MFSRHKRSLIAKLRCGILPLEIETGRWRSKPEHERLCKDCNNGEIENENHFLFRCTTYTEERQRLINNIMQYDCNFINLSAAEKLKLLMSKEYLSVFATYLNDIYRHRTETLYGT